MGLFLIQIVYERRVIVIFDMDPFIIGFSSFFSNLVNGLSIILCDLILIIISRKCNMISMLLFCIWDCLYIISIIIVSIMKLIIMINVYILV